MVVSHPRRPLLLSRLLPECAYWLPIIRAETRTRVSLALFAPANDSSTAVRHTRPARRQHCRSVCLARRSYTCCQPVQQRNTSCLCFEPSDSYAVCRVLSRCITGEENQCRHRDSPQPGYNFDEGNTRLVRRSHRQWSEFGEGNPRSQRCSCLLYTSPSPRD